MYKAVAEGAGLLTLEQHFNSQTTLASAQPHSNTLDLLTAPPGVGTPEFRRLRHRLPAVGPSRAVSDGSDTVPTGLE